MQVILFAAMSAMAEWLVFYDEAEDNVEIASEYEDFMNKEINYPYPTFDELKAWLDAKTEHLDPEDREIVDSCFERAAKYGLEWEIIYTIHRSYDAEGFNVVESLLDACDDWDI